MRTLPNGANRADLASCGFDVMSASTASLTCSIGHTDPRVDQSRVRWVVAAGFVELAVPVVVDECVIPPRMTRSGVIRSAWLNVPSGRRHSFQSSGRRYRR